MKLIPKCLTGFILKMRKGLCGLQKDNSHKTRFFKDGGNTKKRPYKSTIGYSMTRGDTCNSHKVYPTEDDYNNNRYYERRYVRNDFGDDNFYYDLNPSNIDFNYDDYDYSNTEPSEGSRNTGNKYGYFKGTSSNNIDPSEYLYDLINGYDGEIYTSYDENTHKSYKRILNSAFWNNL